MIPPPNDYPLPLSLRSKLEAWRGSPGEVWTTIESGLSWRWISTPPLSAPRHQHSDPRLAPHVSELLKKGVVRPSHYKEAFISRIFPVPKKDGRMRLVLDLSNLNKFIHKRPFKMENHSQLRDLLPLQCWFTSLDLQDAYLHIPIRRRMQRFLSFSWQGVVHSYTALPFGLGIAPQVFTKLMLYPRKLLAAQGISSLCYLDDFILWAPTQESALHHTTLAIEILSNLGFRINPEKSTLTPTQHIDWLGLSWHSPLGTVSLPPEKQHAIITLSQKLLSQDSVPLREWQHFVGLINFASQALPLGRLIFRDIILHAGLQNPRPDSKRVLLSSPLLQAALQSWSSTQFLSDSVSWRHPPPSLTVWTDSSSQGWGLVSSEGHSSQGLWDDEDSLCHITWKELRCFYLTLLEPWSREHKSILLVSDCVSAVACINKQGSTHSTSLHNLTRRILLLASQLNICLTAVHLEGLRNVSADLLSRTSPVMTEWSLPLPAFKRLLEWHGPLDIDLFATPENRRLETFGCPYNHPKATVFDAMSADWNQWDQIYLFPPPKMLPRVIRRLLDHSGHGVIVCPASLHRPWAAALNARCPKQLLLDTQLEQWVQGELHCASPLSYAPLTAYSF